MVVCDLVQRTGAQRIGVHTGPLQQGQIYSGGMSVCLSICLPACPVECTFFTTVCKKYLNLVPRVGPGQSPFPYLFTSLPSTLCFSMFYFYLFPFLTCFVYFLDFPFLPILPE